MFRCLIAHPRMVLIELLRLTFPKSKKSPRISIQIFGGESNKAKGKPFVVRNAMIQADMQNCRIPADERASDRRKRS